jgi:hypothetical protein
MSKVDVMKKLTGLYERSGIFRLRTIIPLSLRSTFGGQTKASNSLRTKVRHEAALAGSKRDAELPHDFMVRA